MSKDKGNSGSNNNSSSGSDGYSNNSSNGNHTMQDIKEKINKVFIDSSVIVEALKGNEYAVAILKSVAEKEDIALMINPIIFSECTYIFMKYAYGSRSRSSYRLQDYKTNLARLFDLLNSFTMLDVNTSIVRVAQDYIQRLNMLPNDALILATCNYYGINTIISLDSDFIEPCRNVSIRLLDKLEEVKML